MKKHSYLAVLTIMLSGWVEASKTYDMCIKNAYSTMDVLVCMGKEQNRLEKKIRKKIEILSKCMPKQRYADIIRLNDKWNEFSEAKCNLFIGASGGTGDNEDAAECLINEESDYLETLQSFVDIYCDDDTNKSE